MTTTPSGCPFAHLDGAYVLGSLSPAERAEYERHLADCAECSRSVRELAGLPGLLARVSPDVLRTAGDVEPVPPTLLPALVAEVRRTERRRVLRTAGLAAAAAAVVVGGAAALVTTLDDGGGPTTAAPSVSASTAPPVTMQALGGEVTGSVSLTSVAWGTRLDLTCAYADAYPRVATETYALYVRGGDGPAERVATWRGLPGREMRVTAATATDAADITSVVVRDGDGQPVLRLTP